MSSLDNAKLKELMKIEPESMSKEEYESFVSEFKNAQLLLPVEIYSKTQSDEINEPLSFKPVTIEENGCKCIPLFTDNEELKKDNPPVSVITIFMKDLKDMLEDSSEIDEIMINPSSKDTVCIDLDSFFDLFEVRNNPNDWIFEKAMPLNQEIRVYYRELEPFMKKQAVNGVYSSPDPLKASVNMHFDDNIPYLNVLILPKDTRTVYLGGMMDPEMSCDILLAPETEFEFVSQEDEHTMIWKCVNQKFYD